MYDNVPGGGFQPLEMQEPGVGVEVVARGGVCVVDARVLPGYDADG